MPDCADPEPEFNDRISDRIDEAEMQSETFATPASLLPPPEALSLDAIPQTSTPVDVEPMQALPADRRPNPIPSPETGLEPAPASQTFALDPRRHHYRLPPAVQRQMQQTAATQTLTPGIYQIEIQEQPSASTAENSPAAAPVTVLLWLQGGRFSLSGEAELRHSAWHTLHLARRLSLVVQEATTVLAFFTGCPLTLSFQRQ